MALIIFYMNGDYDHHRVVRIVDADTDVEVHDDDGRNAVRVRFGTESNAVTFVSDLAQLHRVIVDADRLVARLTVRPIGSGSG